MVLEKFGEDVLNGFNDLWKRAGEHSPGVEGNARQPVDMQRECTLLQEAKFRLDECPMILIGE